MTSSKTQNKVSTANPRHKRPASRRGVTRLLVEALMTAASLVSVVALWVSAASVYASGPLLRYVSVAGLGFPLALFGTVATFVLSILFAPRRCWISLVGLLCVAGSIRSYLPFNPSAADEPSAGSRLSVMSYNVYNFRSVRTDSARTQFLGYILSVAPDIFIFQEGGLNFLTWAAADTAFARRYPYREIPFLGVTTSQGCCSRYPIVRSELITHHTGNGAVAFWLAMPSGDSLLVVNAHLKSNQLTPEDRSQYSEMVRNPEKASRETDATYATSRHLLGKISQAALVRACMADTIIAYLERHHNVPAIVCGDFNDTPISASCQRMRSAGLNDAFRAAGNGVGFTFDNDAIAVRIDHQFCTTHFRPYSARIDHSSDWSDHQPIIATYEICTKNNETLQGR